MIDLLHLLLCHPHCITTVVGGCLVKRWISRVNNLLLLFLYSSAARFGSTIDLAPWPLHWITTINSVELVAVTRVQWVCRRLKRQLTAPAKMLKKTNEIPAKTALPPHWIINPKTYSHQPRQPRARIFFLLFTIQSYFHPGENFWLKPPPCRTPLFTIMLKNFNYENFKLFSIIIQGQARPRGRRAR